MELLDTITVIEDQEWLEAPSTTVAEVVSKVLTQPSGRPTGLSDFLNETSRGSAARLSSQSGSVNTMSTVLFFASAATSVVIGHVAAVSLAHIIALRRLGDPRRAIRSQIPMLVLMVGYTMLSLWIIAQPIVE